MSELSNQKLVQVSNLSVDFISSEGLLSAVDNISFEINKGEILAVVGESGCGKSVTCLSLGALIDDRVSLTKGNVCLYTEGKKLDIFKLSNKELRSIRGGKIAYIFQDPSSSLNPVFKIKDQLLEAIIAHNPEVDNPDQRAQELLDLVGISDSKYRLNSYPCQLSGGMQQRVMIAMALAGNPELLVADEPTTALDVTVQSQILALLKEINKKINMSILLITHNLGLVAQLADKVIIMYAGQIVETALTSEIFETPLHPYTKALLSSTPILGKGKTKLQTIKGSVSQFTKEYKGCRFADRCSLREKYIPMSDKCSNIFPDAMKLSSNHTCYCHFI